MGVCGGGLRYGWVGVEGGLRCGRVGVEGGVVVWVGGCRRGVAVWLGGWGGCGLWCGKVGVKRGLVLTFFFQGWEDDDQVLFTLLVSFRNEELEFLTRPEGFGSFPVW